jgi:drug/metabolite transporter (DMT)-like permease
LGYCFLSAACYTVGLLLFFYALSRTSPVVVSVFGRLQVVFALLISTFILKESLTWKNCLALFGAGSGAFLFFSRQLTGVPSVPELLLISAFSLFFAGSNWIVKTQMKLVHFSIPLLSNYALSVCVSPAVLCAARQFQWPAASSTGLLAASAAITVMSVAAFYSSMRELSFRLSVIIRALSPVVGAAVAFPFFPVPIDIVSCGGAIIFIGSVVGLSLTESKTQIAQVPPSNA